MLDVSKPTLLCALIGSSILNQSALSQSIRVGPVLQNADPNSIWVMWETTSGTESIVEYGLSNQLGELVSGTHIQSQGDAQIHHTQITGLIPETVYQYRVITGNVRSEIKSFRTPALSESEQSFRFAALSDTQGGPISDLHTQTINDGIIQFVREEFGQVLHDELDFVIEPGDLVSTGTNYDQWKDQHFDEGQNLYERVPFYPVPGNHEQDSQWFFDYFNLPLNGTPGFEEHWWYKDHGNIRLIGCDSNHGYRIQEQLDWLDTVLEDAAGNEQIDFVFAQMHHPHLSGIWTPGNTTYTGIIVDKLGQFSDDSGKPSIHFFGHTHAYERGQSKDHNHMYVNVAAGEGGIDYWDQSDIDYDVYQRVFPEWGFVIMEVEAGDNPKFRLRRINRGNDYITRVNEVMDDITIRRYNNQPDTPVIHSPGAGELKIHPDLVTLKANPFIDSDGDTHLESEFVLSLVSGDYEDPIDSQWLRFENWAMPKNAAGGASGSYSVNTVEGVDITEATFSELRGKTTYFWRVRYRDSGLTWSEWSDESSFTTSQAPDGACCYLSGACDTLRENICISEGGKWLGLDSSCEDCPDVLVAYSENFDSVQLGPAVDKSSNDDVWSDTAPSGWGIDRSGIPVGGITEWRGWGFTDPQWWAEVSGDQGRSEFVNAQGVIAVADSDEWDDAPHEPGTYNTWLSSPLIDVSSINPDSAKLVFHSSWRPEGNQRAMILAQYDNGSESVLADWQSVQNENFKPEGISETIVIDMNMPEGTETVVLQFGILDADNNWWWAIDNILVVGVERDHRLTLMDEDFEGVKLGASIDEVSSELVWSNEPPHDWSIDRTGVPSVGIDGVGVTEWEGWAFSDKEWWALIAEDQRRSEFLLGHGTVAVADPDEWDDIGDPDSLGTYNTILSTQTIDIRAAKPGSLELSFDSSWRPEDLQRVQVDAQFDHGSPVTLLDWRSVVGEHYHDHAPNEKVRIKFDHPPGAHELQISFQMHDATNDWWWAIDNVKVSGLCIAEFTDPDTQLNYFDVSRFLNLFSSRDQQADLNQDNAFNFFDIHIFLQAFTTGCS